jgi:hypothetical protein
VGGSDDIDKSKIGGSVGSKKDRLSLSLEFQNINGNDHTKNVSAAIQEGL